VAGYTQHRDVIEAHKVVLGHASHAGRCMYGISARSYPKSMTRPTEYGYCSSVPRNCSTTSRSYRPKPVKLWDKLNRLTRVCRRAVVELPRPTHGQDSRLPCLMPMTTL